MKKDFKKLTSTFKSSIKTWEYLLNWKKVYNNHSELEITLNKLNYLLGKNDLEAEFKKLYKTNPDIIKAFPVLLAIRELKIEIYEPVKRSVEIFDFKNQSQMSTDKYFQFLIDSGLVRLFKEDKVKNLVDYVLGVEVGLDSNGRKNRGGTLMESIVELYIKEFCEKKNLQYLVQANAVKIKEQWSVSIAVDKSSRNFDFAIYNPKSKKLKIFETNFYNGGGSKLKAVCGEFKGLQDTLKAQEIDFIWITDGLGWKNALRPLEEVYEHNDYIFNLSMLEEGCLNKINW